MYPDIQEATAMRIDQFTFGSIRIDGVIYEHDGPQESRQRPTGPSDLEA